MKLRITLLLAALASVCSMFGQSAQTVAEGVYLSSPPTLSNGNVARLLLDSGGRLIVNVGAGSSGNGAASNTGSAVPSQADYCGINVAGTLRGCTGVNPSGSIYAMQTDIASVAGTTIDTNSGNKSAGTIRVVLATDQPNLTSALNVSIQSNAAVNVAQINGVTPLMGNGTTGTGSPRVTIASDNTPFNVITRPENACGTTAYTPAFQYLPGSSTQLTATDTCVTAVYFNNTDTVSHTVDMQDQSTACNSGVCNVFTSFTLPASGWARVPFDGAKFVGGIKWDADTANKVTAILVGNQ